MLEHRYTTKNTQHTRGTQVKLAHTQSHQDLQACSNKRHQSFHFYKQWVMTHASKARERLMSDFDSILFFKINFNGLEWSLCNDNCTLPFSEFICIDLHQKNLIQFKYLILALEFSISMHLLVHFYKIFPSSFDKW